MLPPIRVSRRRAIATLSAAGVGLACGVSSPQYSEPLSLDTLAERYVRLTLQIAQHQPSLIEGWRGSEGWQPGPRRPVAELRAQINEARASLETLAQSIETPIRFRYLQQQFDGLLVAARRLAGESMSFADEARASLGADAGRLVDVAASGAGSGESSFENAIAELNGRLPGRGPLQERYGTFRARHAVSTARVMPTVAAAIAICRQRVRAHIALPDSERVQLEAASALGLQARAVYQGSYVTRVNVDTSSPLDVAGIVWLAAHETYPGHHVQHVLADRDLLQGKGWYERALDPVFGRHLLCSEGGAEAAAALLLHDAAFEDTCRELAATAGVTRRSVSDLVAVHRARASLDLHVVSIGRRYLDGEMSGEDAVEQLAKEALIADPREFLFVIERQRTRILAYPVGRRLASAHVFGGSTADRWERLAHLNTTLTLPIQDS